MEFKEKIIDIQKRLSNIRARCKTQIKQNLSNINKLDDLIVTLFSECEDITWELIQMKIESEEEYYDILNKKASDYRESEIPIRLKADNEYKIASKRLTLVDHLLGEVNRTQQMVNNRRFGLTNAIRIKQIATDITLGE